METEVVNILKEFKQDLARRYGDRVLDLICYGSQARGEAHPDSDIDLALILKEKILPSQEIDRVVDLLAEFNLRYGVLISLMPVDQETWENSTEPFWRNVRREGIRI